MKRLGVILVILIVAGCRGPEVTGSDKDKQMLEAMQKAGGDPNKLDPAMRKQIEDAAKNDPMSSTNRPGGPKAAPGGSGMPPGLATPGGR